MDAALTPAAGADDDLAIHRLLDTVFETYHYDFRHYAMASLRRRLGQAVERLGCASLAELQDRVVREPQLFPLLLGFLTVQVSELFRDPLYFKALRETVIPHLRTYPSLKIWVAGVAHGEELYSLAIMLREEGLDKRCMFYATDINPAALQRAEAGIYPLDRMRLFSENYLAAGGTGSLSDYYRADYGAAIFDRSLRQRVLFSDHSLATDAVFAEMNLISCRNVLIYFDRTLQDRAIGLFRDSLARKGFLGLGAKENLQFSAHAHEFVALSPHERIYQKRAGYHAV